MKRTIGLLRRNRSASGSRSTHGSLTGALIAAIALAILGAAVPALADPPTVNGLFYGDGDDAKYVEYATSYLGSKLYIYFDAPSATLYTALVVNPSVNDNVFGQPDGRKNYMSSVGWGNGGGQQRGANKLTDSEFAQFTFACAPGSTSVWTWNQGYACQSGGQWVADMTCPTSSGATPPGYASATSFAWNINTYEDPSGDPNWDRDIQGTTLSDWVSPYDPSQSPAEALGLDGYPSLAGAGFSTFYQWEWRMVYEWSIPLNASGANCGGDPLYVVTGLSHHSPLKEELGIPPEVCGDPENDCFPGDLTNTDPLSDYGDLPDIYGTTSAGGGPYHNLKVNGPYFGEAIISELDGQPTTDGSGDGAEEDGVEAVVTSMWNPGTSQTVTVEVSNAPTGALVGGWFDWNGDGDFDDPDEFVASSVVEGVNIISVTVGPEFDPTADVLNTRFRLFSSGAAAPGGTLDWTDSVGEATDGEVEDYVWDAGTLPVTLNAFSSSGTAGGEITVRWQTASETDNIGFELLGLVNGHWQTLGDFIPSRDMNSRLPKDYEIVVETPPNMSRLQLIDYNSRGVIERYGPFRLGARHGETQEAQRIDWTAARSEREQQLLDRGFRTIEGNSSATSDRRLDRRTTWKRLATEIAVPDGQSPGGTAREIPVSIAPTGAPGPTKTSVLVDEGRMTHVAVTEEGVQRITYEALLDGGLDLAGVRSRDIAVTWRGKAVARFVDGPQIFGPGSAIEFIGRPPRGDDARYIAANNYQVSVNPKLAREAGHVPWAATPRVSPSYVTESTVDRPLVHHSQSPTGDPWIERTVLARSGSPSTVTLAIEVSDDVLDGDHRLVLDLGTITDLPDVTDANGNVIPEHNVEISLSGPDTGFVPVATSSTSDQRKWHIEADLPGDLIDTGLNQIELRFSTDYIFSLVVIDSYSVTFPTPYRGPELDFAPDRRAHGYRVEGFSGPTVVAYSLSNNGGLTRHQVSVQPTDSGFAAEFRQNRSSVANHAGRDPGQSAYRTWVTENPYTPVVFTTEAPDDLLSKQPSDLLIVAGSNFIGTPALDEYLAGTTEFNPTVVDVEDIYNAVGFGMALPSAITDYLAARYEISPFSHVQLVGADCYDRRNYISQCVSFVPLPTAPVPPTLYSPSHNRLADLDGDGVADVAVAQFSVRTADELATIIDKASTWYGNEIGDAGSVLLIAEEGDGVHDFLGQVHRVVDQLDAPQRDVLDLSLHPDIATAREAMRSSLDDGRAITVFSGHSSSVMWAYRGLLTPSSAAALTNVDAPTLMVPLACETNYDISPTADVLGHRLLFSGAQGALAISGAVSLASLNENELMADQVLAGLEAGKTLGEAVQAGREALGSNFQTLQDNWLTQGDVTLKLER